MAGHTVVGDCQAIGSSGETLSGCVTDTVANQWLSPPAAGALPCGWATAQHYESVNAQKRSVFDVERDCGLACEITAADILQ